MKDAREFFEREVIRAMGRIRFENRTIRGFLTELLESNVHPAPEDNVFCVRKEPALAFMTCDPMASLEKVERVVKRLLFVTGFFPESLVARGKRRVGLGYYLMTEKSLVRRLSPHYSVWAEVHRNFYPTVKSLSLVRSTMSIKKPDIVTLSEIIKSTGDMYAFY